MIKYSTNWTVVASVLSSFRVYRRELAYYFINHVAYLCYYKILKVNVKLTRIEKKERCVAAHMRHAATCYDMQLPIYSLV